MISPLKTCFTGLVAAALLSSAGAQTSSSTPVIGYYKFQAPQGKSMWNCAFVTKTEFQGLATSVAGGATTVITQTGATWTANQFQTSAVPATSSSHYIEILSGANAGQNVDIVSNTPTTITLNGNFGSTAFTYAVRKHTTIGSIFITAGLTEFEDEVLLFDSAGVSRSYQFDATPGSEQMVDAPTGSIPSSDVVVYPGQGFVLTIGTAKTLTFGGGTVSYVKTTPTVVPLYQGKSNIVGLLDPLVASNPLVTAAANEQHAIGSIGLQTSGLSPYEDEIQVFGLSAGNFTRLGIYYYDDSIPGIADINGTDVSSTLSIQNGTAILVKPLGADRLLSSPGFNP